MDEPNPGRPPSHGSPDTGFVEAARSCATPDQHSSETRTMGEPPRSGKGGDDPVALRLGIVLGTQSPMADSKLHTPGCCAAAFGGASRRPRPSSAPALQQRRQQPLPPRARPQLRGSSAMSAAHPAAPGCPWPGPLVSCGWTQCLGRPWPTGDPRLRQAAARWLACLLP